MSPNPSTIKRKPKAKRKELASRFDALTISLSHVAVKAVKLSVDELDARRKMAGVPKSKLLVP